MLANSTKKSILFSLDISLWVFILFVTMNYFHSADRVSSVIALMAMTILWLFVYKDYSATLAFFSHLIKISATLTGLFLVFSIGIGKIHDFYTLFFCTASWVMLALLVRVFATALRPKLTILLAPGVNISTMDSVKILPWGPTQINIDLRQCDYLVADLEGHYDEAVKKVIAHAQVIGLTVITPQTLTEIIEGKLNVHALQQDWLNSSFQFSHSYRALKRFLDFSLSLLALPFLIFLFAIISTLIFASMGRPIFFTQYRSGQESQPFKIYKFRTMQNAHGELKETVQNDPRITPLGKFLRKYRFDELPQILNVLKGQMSFIGPRPEWVVTAEKFSQEIPVYYARHLVKPGISGWAQVNQGHAIGVNENLEKLQYDLYYVKNFSLLLDIKIFLMTIKCVLTGSGSK